MAAVYEALNESAFYLTGGLRLQVQDALLGMINYSRYPPLTLLSEIVVQLNLPDQHILTLLVKHGYPKIPDFEVVVNDCHYLIKRSLRHREGFPFFMDDVKRLILSKFNSILSKVT